MKNLHIYNKNWWGKVLASILKTYDAIAMATIVFSPSLTAVVIATLSAHVESG